MSDREAQLGGSENADPLPREEVARRWSEEIMRRAGRALAGESVGQDAIEVLEAIESRLRQRTEQR